MLRRHGPVPGASLQRGAQDGRRSLRRHRAWRRAWWPRSNPPARSPPSIADGLGATILPASMAREVVASCDAWLCRIVDPVIEAPLALCQSDHLPLSEPAQAVKEILLELVADAAGRACSRPRGARATRRHKPPLSRHRHSVLALRPAPATFCLPSRVRGMRRPPGVRPRRAGMDPQQIKTLIDAMAASDLAEMEFSQDGWTLRLVRAAPATRADAGTRRRACDALRRRTVTRCRGPTRSGAVESQARPSCARRSTASSTSALAGRAAVRAAGPGRRGRADAVRHRGDEGVQRSPRRARRDRRRAVLVTRARRSRPASRCCASR